jgi:glycosyltransferase involved in cell wall biosynthesis
MTKHIWMIAYTNYSIDARVRREAEAIASVAEYDVHLMALREGAEPRTYVLDGVTVHELDIAKFRGGSLIKYLVSYIRFLGLVFVKCSQLCWRGVIDLVHVHNMPNFLVFAAILPRCVGTKIVLDVHDTLIETYATKFSSLMSRFIAVALALEEFLSCNFASSVICVNAPQRDALLTRGVPRRKTLVLMNLPDPRKFQLNGPVEQPGNGTFKIVYFGTITYRLGVDLLLRAIHGARTLVPGIQCFVYGDGDGRRECIELCRKLGLQEVVQFSEGAVPLDELILNVKRMDLVVVPNRRNTATALMLPVKMLEGMAMGIPVVVPRLKTIEHYFSDDQVFYYEPEDVPSLIESIVRAHNDLAARAKTVESALRFFEKHSWESQKHDLLQLYRSLMRGQA